MADKGFFSRFFQAKEVDDVEVKALRDKLDQVIGEKLDNESYDAKFLDSEPSTFNSAFSSDFSGIDQQIDLAALQRIYATETWVYTAINAIAKTIAGLPLKLERKQVFNKEVTNQITGEKEIVKQEAWVDATGEKLFKLFQHPNKNTSKAEFLMLIMIDLLTTGSYYIYLDSDEDLSAIENNRSDDEPDSPFGRLRTMLAAGTHIKGMYRIPPPLLKAVPSQDHREIDGYILQTDKGAYAFNRAEIIHVKLPNPNDPFSGLPPLIPVFKPVLLDRFSTEHMIRFYKSGARLGGIIESEKPLNNNQIVRLQRTFEANYTGRNNHHRTLILPDGMKYNPVEQNPAETSLIEFCKYNQQAILSAYNVPPIKVGILEHANYANAQAQLKIFFTDTIIPYLTFVQDGFNNHAAMMPDNHSYRIVFDLSNVEALQENYKDKAEAAFGMLKSGLTVNEVRETVWKKSAISGGDKAPAVENMNNPNQGFSGQTLSAPTNQIDTKEALPNVQADTALLSDVTPTDMTFSARVAQLVEVFTSGGVPLSIAIIKAIEQARLEGFVDETESAKPSISQEPTNEEGKEMNTEDQGALIPTAIGVAKPIEEPTCTMCNKKPCECKGKSDKDGQAPTLGEFLASAIASLDDAQEITPELIADLKKQHSDKYGDVVSNKEAEVKYANGYDKEAIVSHWKNFINKTDPLVTKREAELKKFFKDFKRLVMNRFGGNLKSFGAHKSRNSDDADDILKAEAYKKLVDDYIKDIDHALESAMTEGYADTLVTFEFGPPSKDAKDALRKFATMSANSVTDTTREQLKTLLVDMFEQGKSVTEIGAAIADKFEEIETGRAMTIARTETLTAVSIGKAAKRTEWRNRFPKQKLMKMWVTSQDDRVRDTHADLEGVSVESTEPFPNGLFYPRDPGSNNPSETINCRCDVIDYAEEDQALIEQNSFDEESDEG